MDFAVLEPSSRISGVPRRGARAALQGWADMSWFGRMIPRRWKTWGAVAGVCLGGVFSHAGAQEFSQALSGPAAGEASLATESILRRLNELESELKTMRDE